MIILTVVKCNYDGCECNKNGECSKLLVVISVSGECEKAKKLDSEKTTLVYPKG